MKTKTKKSGSSAADAYHSKWEYFGALNFLNRAMDDSENTRLDSAETQVRIKRDHIENRQLHHT